MKIKILLADENHLFMELLAARLSETSDFEVVAEASNSAEILDKVGLTHPDIVLTEALTTQLNGIELTKTLQKHHPKVKVVALTTHSEKSIIKGMLEAQAWGYLLQSGTLEQLCASLLHIHEGRKQLSPQAQDVLINDYLSHGGIKGDSLTKRESEILKLLAEGKSIREISGIFFISIKTAGTHKQNIFEKLGLDNLSQLVRYALKNGIIS